MRCELGGGSGYPGEGGYHRRYKEERGYITLQIDSDPAFSRVQIREKSDGGAWLDGRVKIAEDRDRLLEKLIQAVGEPRAKDAIAGVKVSSNP